MDTEFKKRSTKALKRKKTYELNGKFSSKHLRICENLKTKNNKTGMPTAKNN